MATKTPQQYLAEERDQQAIALAKAIRQHETGNRPVAGQTGELPSRYQFIPSTWKSEAGRILGDPNAPLTLENENRVAYVRIKEWKDKGYTPKQIASMWNSGNPDPYAKGNKGVGASSTNPNVQFNVPKYVESVYANYQKFKPVQQPVIETPTAQPVEEKKSLLSRAGSFIKQDILGGGVQGETNLAGDIFRSTVGSRSAAGVGQEVAKNLYSLVSGGSYEKEATALSESQAGLADQTTKLIKSLPSITDPIRRANLQKLVKENLDTLAKSNITYKDLVETTGALETPKESAKQYGTSAANAILTKFTGSGSGVTSATRGLLGRTSVGTLSKVPGLLPTAEKVLTAGKGIIPRIAEQAGLGVGFAASENIRTGQPVGTNLGTAAVFGGALPVAGAGVSKIKSALPKIETKMAQRLIDSLIKPLMKDLSYGKNPGARVASEGIVFNSLEEGAEKITQRLNEIGQEMDAVISSPRFQGKVYDMSNSLKAIDDEIAYLSKNPRTNAPIISRLQAAKADLMGEVINPDGSISYAKNLKQMTIDQAVEFKRDIASLARYTGAASDDKAYNKAIQMSARNAKNKINEIAPEMKNLNERWADLKSAETAIKYRDKIEQRQNIIKFPSKLLGGGSLIAGTATLNPAIIAAGIATLGIEKLFGSSAFKTRMAKWLSKATPEDKVKLLRDAPILKPVLDRIFGKEKELNENQIKELLNQWNSKAGLTIRDISNGKAGYESFNKGVAPKTALPIKKSDPIIQEAKKYKSANEVYDALGFTEGAKETIIPIKYKENVVGGIDASMKRGSPDTLQVHYVRILPEAQGKGIGTEAVAKLFKDNPKIKTLEGHATAESKSFWKKQGATFSGSENNIFTIKRSQLSQNPLVEEARKYKKTIDWLIKNKLHPDQPLMLPAPRQGTPSGNIELPARTGDAGRTKIEVLPAQKTTGRGEKGQFKRVYTSLPIKATKKSIPIKKVNPAVGETVIPKATGLSKVDSDIEDKVIQRIQKEEDTILNNYQKQNGNYINADDMRPIFVAEGYNGANAAAVQEPVSYLSKKAYTNALKNPGEYATFTSGMSGAGKTSALKNVPEFGKIKSDSAVVFDSNLSNYNSAVKKINESTQAGKVPRIYYVFREPLEGFENGVVKRMLRNKSEMGRVVPTKIIAENAPGSFSVAERLYNQGVDVRFIDNSLGAGNAKEVTLQEIKNKAKFPSDLKSKLDIKAKQLYEQGKISAEQYKAYTS